MMALATVVVDEGHGVEPGAQTVTYDFDTLAEAQDKSAALGSEWKAAGWRKNHEVWLLGNKWRQKVIVVGGAGGDKFDNGRPKGVIAE